jgi:flagellar biosynthetic protein FlhB
VAQYCTAFYIVFLISAIVSVLDYFWQKFDYKRKLMMTRQEITDEMKDSEGDPHMKHKRRQMGNDIASQRMMEDVPDADVIVVNPQHFAVALKWDRSAGSAPVCVAKGVDEIARRIREIAAASGVPIHRDPPTARSLFATVEIGQEVEPDHYKPVAAAIRYAEKMRKLADKRTYD